MYYQELRGQHMYKCQNTCTLHVQVKSESHLNNSRFSHLSYHQLKTLKKEKCQWWTHPSTHTMKLEAAKVYGIQSIIWRSYHCITVLHGGVGGGGGGSYTQMLFSHTKHLFIRQLLKNDGWEKKVHQGNFFLFLSICCGLKKPINLMQAKILTETSWAF